MAKSPGAKLMAHHEPIVLIGIPPERIAAFIRGYVGRDVLQIATQAPSARPAVDIVSGATVTVAVIAESMVRSAIRVARAEGIGGTATIAPPAVREIDPSHEAPADWLGLLGDGSVRHLSLTVADVTDAFKRAGNPIAADRPETADPAASFIDMYVAPVSVPAIGKRLLGDAGFTALQQSLQPGQQAILIAANGAYSFKGTGYVRGGIFDRIEVLQGDSSIHFRDRTHTRLGDVARGGCAILPDVDLFRVPAESTLLVTEPWRLQLLVQRAVGARDKAFLTFDLGYELPQAYLNPPAAATLAAAVTAQSALSGADASEPPMWQMMWWDKTVPDRRFAGGAKPAHPDLLLSGLVGATARALRPAASRFHGFHTGLDRLVCAGAAFRGQCPRLLERPADRFPLGLFPDGATDFHSVVRHRGVPAVLEPWRLLRLAVPVRRVAGTHQPYRPAAENSAAKDPVRRRISG